jgi:hypothetical protein
VAVSSLQFALTRDEAKRLFAAKSDEAMREFIDSLVQSPEVRQQERICESHGAWDPIQRCLARGTLDPAAGEPPLRECILGGRELALGVRLVRPDMVPHIDAALEPITREALRGQYDRIDPTDYGRPLSDADFQSTWAIFQQLRDFYRRAAAAGHAVIFARV